MIEGFFFDRIDCRRDWARIESRVKASSAVDARGAFSEFIRRDHAFSWTEQALNGRIRLARRVAARVPREASDSLSVWECKGVGLILSRLWNAALFFVDFPPPRRDELRFDRL